MAFIGNTNTTQAFTPTIDYFSGNGSTTAFTLSRPVASVAQVQVTIDNVAQNPSAAYTVSSNTITFTSAPLSGTNNIYVYYTSPITQVIAPGQGTVTSDSFGTITNFTTTGNTVLGDATTDTLTVGVTGIVKDSSGNVGIGTASPAYPLDVAGNLRSNSWIGRANGSAPSADCAIYRATDNTLGFSTASTERMRIDSSGNLLVNTTTASSKFCVNAEMSLLTDGNNRGIIGWDNTDKRISFGTINASTAYFNAMSLRDGNLLVGTTSANGLGVTISGTQGNNFWVSNANTSSAYNQLSFRINGTVVGVIQTSGSSTSYQTSSDYRLKENILPMTGALAKVSQLKPVTYKWKSDGSDGQGFIAHELQEVIPDCVGGTKDAVDEEGNPVYQGIDTSFLVATLTAAIQELKAINDTQAETINALTARIVALENR
jgi:hypothetical protein